MKIWERSKKRSVNQFTKELWQTTTSRGVTPKAFLLTPQVTNSLTTMFSWTFHALFVIIVSTAVYGDERWKMNGRWVFCNNLRMHIVSTNTLYARTAKYIIVIVFDSDPIGKYIAHWAEEVMKMFGLRWSCEPRAGTFRYLFSWCQSWGISRYWGGSRVRRLEWASSWRRCRRQHKQRHEAT